MSQSSNEEKTSATVKFLKFSSLCYKLLHWFLYFSVGPI